jgi:hypothetical protein
MEEKPQTLAAGIIDRRAKLIPAKRLAVRRQLKEQRTRTIVGEERRQFEDIIVTLSVLAAVSFATP